MKDYLDKRGIKYEPETGDRSWTSVEVLPFLKGKKWDEVALAYVHSLRPSSIRVTPDYETADAETWRVTVRVNKDNIIQEIEQEVEVWLPEGIAHGHALTHALAWGIDSEQCKWHLDAEGTMYDGINGKYYKFTKDGKTVPFPESRKEKNENK